MFSLLLKELIFYFYLHVPSLPTLLSESVNRMSQAGISGINTVLLKYFIALFLLIRFNQLELTRQILPITHTRFNAKASYYNNSLSPLNRQYHEYQKLYRSENYFTRKRKQP